MDLCKAELIDLSKEDIINRIVNEQEKFRKYVMKESAKNIHDLIREELEYEFLIEIKKSNILNKFVKNLEHDISVLNNQLTTWKIEVQRLKTELEGVKQKEIENAQFKATLRDFKRIEVLSQNIQYEEILTVHTKEELVEIIWKDRKEFQIVISQTMLQAKTLASKNSELEEQINSLNQELDKLKVELQTSNLLKDVFDAELKAREEQDQITQKVIIYC